jgi:hypothetical protein
VLVKLDHVGLGKCLDLCSVFIDYRLALVEFSCIIYYQDSPSSKSRYSLSIYDQRRLDS